MTKKTGSGRIQDQTLAEFLARRLAVAVLICAALVTVFELALADVARRNAENAAIEDLNRLRASIQQILSRDVQIIRGMTGYVRVRPNLSAEEFNLIAQDILETAPDHIKNLALAKDLVISHIYPLSGNEAAVGLDYRQNTSQWPAVKRAIEEHGIIIAGPLELVQGGTALIARLPIFLRPSDDRHRALWGIASTVIDFPGMLAHAGYPEFEKEYRLALSGRDGDPSNADLMWGDPEVATTEPVVLDVVVPNGSWRILAAPRAGWPSVTSYLPQTIAAAAAVLVIFAMWSVSQYRIARERSSASQEVLVALQQAEEASAAKSTFLAVMSHELRTPLNAIIGFSELLENSPKSSPVWDRAQEYVGDIRQSGRFLLTIIDDILDLSRIESGRRDTTIEHVDVVPLIIESANRLRIEFDAKKSALAVSATSEQIIALGDQRAIMQILNNLLTNALKYAGTEASVEVAATLVDGDKVSISVSDNGPGIPEDRLDEIMQPFVQLSSSYAREAGGVGLGLTICQSLARLMNGELAVESRLGAGTTVRLTLARSPIA